MKKAILIFSALICLSGMISAQEKGYLTGSFESNDHFYVDDEANKFVPTGDRFGSNNYLKVDYYKGHFSAGLQLES